MLALSRIQFFRHLTRSAVIALFIALPLLNHANFDGLRGTLFVFDAFGVPFADPLGATQVFLCGKLPGWRLVGGAFLILLLSALAGRVFCSWICPYGACSDAIHSARKHLFPVCSQNESPPSKSFPLRLRIVLTGLVLVLLTGVPVLNFLSMPGWISLELAKLGTFIAIGDVTFSLADGIVLSCISLVLLGEAGYGQRIWCRICPQSVLLSLAAHGLTVARQSWRWFQSVPEIRLVRKASRCTCGWPDGSLERPCRSACPFGLFPGKPLPPASSVSEQFPAVSTLECIHCGKCLSACSQRHSRFPALHIHPLPQPPVHKEHP